MNYDDMVSKVADRAGLTAESADESIVATLTVLGERVTATEMRDMLSQLPKTLKEGIPIGPQATTFSPDEFVTRVADLLPGADVANGEARVRAVFSVLTEAVSAGEMRDIADQLGDDYAELTGRPRREPSGADAKRDARAAVRAAVSRGTDVAQDAVRSVGGVVSGAATGAVRRTRTIVERVPAVMSQTVRRAGAIGARKTEAVADVVEDAADAVEDSAERAAERFENRAHTG